MQLDPNSALRPQLLSASSTALERLTAATCAALGYTVFRGLRYEIDGQMAAEADVLASIMTPLRESRVVIECKGGVPTFLDLREVSSLNLLLVPPPDELLVISHINCPENRKQVASSLGIRIVEKANLVYYVVPLLGGAGAVRVRRVKELNWYLAWQVLHEFYTARVRSHGQMHQHYRFLVSELWTIGDPETQVQASFDAYINRFPGTSDVVRTDKGLTQRQAVYEARDDDFEAAMYVVLLHRLANIYAVTRYTLNLMQHRSSQHLLANAGYNLQAAITSLSSRPRLFFGFPSFLQTFLFVWGGFLVESRREWEVQQMANEAGVSVEAVELYLEILATVYSGALTDLFYSWSGLYFFKYVPGAVRALGWRHRRAIDSATYGPLSFFGPSEPFYEAALDRGLGQIGGSAHLRF